MKLTERILISLTVLGVLLKLLLIPGASIIFLISIVLLWGLYFVFGFALFNNIRLRNIFKGKSYAHTNALRITGAACTGIVLSMLLNGILFKILHWPGAQVMLLSGPFPAGVII